MHSDGGTDFHVSADLFLCERSSAARYGPAVSFTTKAEPGAYSVIVPVPMVVVVVVVVVVLCAKTTGVDIAHTMPSKVVLIFIN